MMKIFISILMCLLIVFDLITYFQVKKYVKIHANEPMEDHKKYIFSRMVVILILGGIVAVLGIIAQLV